MSKFSDFFSSEWQKAQPQERGGISAWSYSRLAKWETCPRSAYYEYVQKRGTGEKSPAMLRGLAAHAECAAIYEGKPPMPHKDSILSREWRDTLVGQRADWFPDLEAELQVAYNAEWQRRKWFDKDVVFRCAFDGIAYSDRSSLVIYEHKTGKVYNTHKDQAELYACVAHKMNPEANDVVVNIQYLDLPASRPKTVHSWTAAELMVGHEGKPLINKWIQKANAMMADRDFPMRAGPQCRYCQFRGENGGPCDIWS